MYNGVSSELFTLNLNERPEKIDASTFLPSLNCYGELKRYACCDQAGLRIKSLDSRVPHFIDALSPLFRPKRLKPRSEIALGGGKIGDVQNGLFNVMVCPNPPPSCKTAGFYLS